VGRHEAPANAGGLLLRVNAEGVLRQAGRAEYPGAVPVDERLAVPILLKDGIAKI
jgi:hypothetical protein